METVAVRVAAARAAVEPYRWWLLTPEMFVRRVLRAVDAVDGARPRGYAGFDPRLEALVATITAVPWRRLRLAATCQLLLDALDEWRDADAWLDLELTWLLERGA